MSFVSVSWLGWIAAVTAVFWALPARFRTLFLILATLVFIGWTDPLSLGVLAALTGLTIVATRERAVPGWRAVLCVGAIVAVLAGFKIAVGPIDDAGVADLAMPLGLSYYALRCIHYVIERYTGRIAAAPGLDVVAFLFFIPTIFIGPIHRFPEFRRDLARHRWDEALFSEGVERIIHGYARIVILGNFLIVNLTETLTQALGPDRTAAVTYIAMVSTGLNLYVQFAGHSDIAIGFARLLGFRVMENFDRPYLKPNISAFWRAWHISLTSWARDYVYGSVVALTRSPALGAVTTLVAIGLWHEISLRYLVWGAYHGLAIVVWQQVQVWKRALPAPRSTAVRGALHVLAVLLTLHFVWLGFLLVRQPDPGAMWSIVVTLVSGGW